MIKPEKHCRFFLLLALLCTTHLVAADDSHVLPAQGSVAWAFSPDGNPQSLIIDVIDSAQKELRVQVYIFTSIPIAKALLRAHQRGVDVQVLADGEMNRRGSGKALPMLLNAGIPLAFETLYKSAHNKVIIADAEGPQCVVLTGSYNFTWSANNRNAENVLVLRENCPLAQAYLENWQRHRAQAVVVTQFPWKPPQQ